MLMFSIIILPISTSAIEITPPVSIGTPTLTPTESDASVTTTPTPVLPGGIQARQAVQAKRANIDAEKALNVAKKEALSAARCAKVESQVVLKVTRFEANLSRRHAFFNRFSKRVEKLIAKFDEGGYDTTKLKADQIILNQKIEAYAAAKTAYIVILKESQQYACGKSEGEFRSKILDAKEALDEARLANLAVKTYYQETIRPDINALKAQVRATTPTLTPTVTGTPE